LLVNKANRFVLNKTSLFHKSPCLIGGGATKSKWNKQITTTTQSFGLH